jgi:proteasome beta subunit
MYGVLEDNFTEGMSRIEALKLAARALYASGQRDAASGNGMDLAVITAKDGYQQVSEQELSKLLK